MLDILRNLDNISIILAALLAVSEALALIPSIKSKSVFQLIQNFLRSSIGLIAKNRLLKK